MRNGRRWKRREAKDSVSCVGTHAFSVVQMAEMDATQKRVWGVGQGGRRETQRSSSTHTHTHTRSSLSFSEMTVIHYRSLTDLIPECSPSVTPADLCQCDTVGRGNPPAARREALLTRSEFQHHGQRLACSTTCTFQLFPRFHSLCLCSEKRAFNSIFTLARLSACLLRREMVSCNLHLKDYSVYFNWDLIWEIVTVTSHDISLTSWIA